MPHTGRSRAYKSRAGHRKPTTLPRRTTGGGTLGKPASTSRPKRTLPRQAAAKAKARAFGARGKAKRKAR